MAEKEVFATTPKVTTERRVIKGPPAPQRTTIYAKDGSPLMVYPIDAKEIVAGGEYSFEPPVSEAAQATGNPFNEPPDLEAMTKAELQEYGSSHGVQLDASMLKADMLEAARGIK